MSLRLKLLGISSGHIHNVVAGKSDAVGQLFSPPSPHSRRLLRKQGKQRIVDKGKQNHESMNPIMYNTTVHMLMMLAMTIMMRTLIEAEERMRARAQDTAWR